MYIPYKFCKKFRNIYPQLLVNSSRNSIIVLYCFYYFWVFIYLNVLGIFKFSTMNDFFNQKLLAFFLKFLHPDRILEFSRLSNFSSMASISFYIVIETMKQILSIFVRVQIIFRHRQWKMLSKIG